MADQLDLQELIAALSQPAAYPHPVGEVRVVQTHASCVFLAGEFAYKLKKAVDFGFLDYRTLAARKRHCLREVELNRRLCPEVYLDVQPVGRMNGQLRVGAPGPALEWAVRMRRLPEQEMLPARLAAGTVSPADAERLAERLARFHAEAETSPEIEAFGTAEAVSRNVEENFQQTSARTGDLLPAAHLDAVRECSRSFLRNRAELFLSRIRDGRVRDGHGDLRAQNLCLDPATGSGLQVFDCIEFNNRFRYGDVAADLAYLAMDLDLAGAAALRWSVITHYQRLSADPSLLEALPFYQCYRAYVRGKIALLAAEEEEVPAAERAAHRKLAAAAFDLSRSYASHRTAPALLITVAYSGAGKSVLARELARRLPAVHLSSDTLRKQRLGVPSESRLTAEQYGQSQRGVVYQELYRQARTWLERGEHVLLDATFLSEQEQLVAEALARETGAEFWVLACEAPDPVIRVRLEERSRHGEDASDAGLVVYEAQRREHPTLPVANPAAQRWRADTTAPPAQTARRFLERFWEKPAPQEPSTPATTTAP